MGKNAKPQTPDPGASHAASGEKIMGPVDFGGQDVHDEQQGDTPEGELSDGRTDIHCGMSRAEYTRLDNPVNGSGGSSKTIAPSKVRGSNP